MDLNVCPLCRAPDANGFCGCLSVMAKSEDYIDLKNQADPKKRIKEAPGEHEGLVPSDRPIKEVDTGDGTGGDIKKGKKVGGKMEKAEMTPAAPGMAPKPPMAPAAVKLPGTGSAPTIAKPTLPSAGNTPRTAAGPAQIKLPGAGMGHAPKIKQQAGGNVISANPPPAAPGLGSMKGPMMKTEFKELSKSEDFGKCVLCGNNEHIGVCK